MPRLTKKGSYCVAGISKNCHECKKLTGCYSGMGKGDGQADTFPEGLTHPSGEAFVFAGLWDAFFEGKEL